MIRHFACLAMALLAGIPLRAGELDTEFGGQTPPVPAVTPVTSRTATYESAPLLAATRDVKPGALKASELDEEMPSQAWRRGFGYGGFGRGIGYGGFGRGFGLSFGYGGLGYGGLGYGGLGYGGLGYGGGYGLASNYLGYGYGGFSSGCYW